jgi:hypothetical protein
MSGIAGMCIVRFEKPEMEATAKAAASRATMEFSKLKRQWKTLLR